METLVSIEQLAAEDTPCRIAVRRAEDARQESRILGYILIGLVGIVALAAAVVIGLAVAGETTAAIITAVGGVVDGVIAGFVVKRRNEANTRAATAISDAKTVCGPETSATLPS